MGGLVERTTVSGGWTLLVIRYFALFGQGNYKTTHKTKLIEVYFFLQLRLSFFLSSKGIIEGICTPWGTNPLTLYTAYVVHTASFV